MEIIQRFDDNLLQILNDFVQRSSALTSLTVFLAERLIYLVPILLIIFWFWPHKLDFKKSKEIIREDLLLSSLAGVFGWVVLSPIFGKLWFRARPFDSLLDAKELLLHRPTYSFPSDHAMFLFTVATSAWVLGYKTSAKWLFAIATIVSISRVAVAVHWPTDVIAGAFIGIALGYGVKSIEKSLRKYIAKPLVNLAKVLKLA